MEYRDRNRRMKQRRASIFQAVSLAGVLLLAAWTVAGPPAAADTTAAIQKNVGRSIEVRQASQNEQEQWDEKRQELITLYERLKAENEALNAEHGTLTAQAAHLLEQVQALEEEKAQTRRIRGEIKPFLLSVQETLQNLVTTDIPFLAEERKNRLAGLDRVINDPGVTMAEKFRRVMEALSVEAEYGNTIEVYEDRIMLDNTPMQGHIFRLGRIGLYYLSLDGRKAAVFDVGQNDWCRLEDRFVPPVAAAVDIALKRRTTGILDFPLGRLAVP